MTGDEIEAYRERRVFEWTNHIEEWVLPTGHALRRAAGLSDQENPFITYSDEAHLPVLGDVVCRVMLATLPPQWHNPRTAKTKLEKVRKDIKVLKNRITAIDLCTQIAINNAGSPHMQEYLAAKQQSINAPSRETFDRAHAAFDAAYGGPPDELAVPTMLALLEQFETAIVSTIEQIIKEGESLKEKGRIWNHEKNAIALIVAQYLHAVTGDIPGLTIRPVVAGPFALALQDIFEILGLPKVVQRPGEYAISELTSKLSTKSYICPLARWR